MWAFGVTVFVLCTGKFPWREASLRDPDFARYVAGAPSRRHAHAWTSFSPALACLLRGAICVDVSKRFTIAEAREFIASHWLPSTAAHSNGCVSPSSGSVSSANGASPPPYSSPQLVYATPEDSPRLISSDSLKT